MKKQVLVTISSPQECPHLVHKCTVIANNPPGSCVASSKEIPDDCPLVNVPEAKGVAA